MFLVRCAERRRIEWVYHNAGEAALLNGSEQYEHLADLRAVRRCSPVHMAWRHIEGSLAIWLAPVTEEDVFTGTSPGHPPSERLGFLLRRRNDAQTIFVSVFHPYKDKPLIREVNWGSEGRFEVQLEDRRDQWDLHELIYARTKAELQDSAEHR